MRITSDILDTCPPATMHTPHKHACPPTMHTPPETMHTPPETMQAPPWTESQTPVKTSPSSNFVCCR